MSSEKTFNKLRINLYKSFVFYLPGNIFELQHQDLRNDVTQILDKIIVINENGNISELKNQPVLTTILQKQKTLDNNLFKLLDIRKNLKTAEFDFFVNKYLEKVNFCLYITKWLNDNLELYPFGINEEVKKAFQFQLHFFQEHFNNLNGQLNSNKNEVQQAPDNIVQFIENNFKELKETLTNQKAEIGLVNNEHEKQFQDTNLTNEKELKKKKEKLILITEEEAEAFLLKTVFNLKV